MPPFTAPFTAGAARLLCLVTANLILSGTASDVASPAVPDAPGGNTPEPTPESTVPAECTTAVFVGPSGTNASEKRWPRGVNASSMRCGESVRSACPTLEVAFRQYQIISMETDRQQRELPCFLLAGSLESKCEIQLGNIGSISSPFRPNDSSKKYKILSSSENGCLHAVVNVTTALAPRLALRDQGGLPFRTYYCIFFATNIIEVIGVRFIGRVIGQPGSQNILYLIFTKYSITMTRCEFLMSPGVAVLKLYMYRRDSFGDVVIRDSMFTGIPARKGEWNRLLPQQPMLAFEGERDELVNTVISGCTFSNFSPQHSSPLVSTTGNLGLTVLNTTFVNLTILTSVLKAYRERTMSKTRFDNNITILGSYFKSTVCLRAPCIDLRGKHPAIDITRCEFHKSTDTPAMISIAAKSNIMLNIRQCSFHSPPAFTTCSDPRHAYWVELEADSKKATFTDCSYSIGPTLIWSKYTDLAFFGTTTLLRSSEMLGTAPTECVPFIADYGRIIVNAPISGIHFDPWFPKYPSTRRTVLQKISYWKYQRDTQNEEYNSALSHIRNLSLLVQDMYCQRHYCMQTMISRLKKYFNPNSIARNNALSAARRTPLDNAFPVYAGQRQGYTQCHPLWLFYGEADTNKDPQGRSSCICNLYKLPNETHPQSGTCTRDNSATKYYADIGLCTYIHKSKSLLVINKIDVLRNLIKTPASWLLFRSSTVQCYKNWRGYIYVLRSCSRDNWAALGREFGWADVSRPELISLRETIIANDSTSTNVAIGPQFTVTPWSFITAPPAITHNYCKDQIRTTEPEKCDKYIGTITLMPAPGEHVSLGVDTLDNGLSRVDAIMTMSVQSTPTKSNGNVLLIQLSGNGNEAVEELVFISDGNLSDFALLGNPWSAGFLTVTTSSDVLGTSRLRVPFLLRPCHMGYEQATITVSGKRIDTCRRNTQQLGIVADANGRSIQVESGFWGGDLSDTSLNLKSNFKLTGRARLPFTAYKLPLVESEEQTLDVLYIRRPVGLGQCTHRFCLNEPWWIHSGEGSGCVSGYTGPFCGKCNGDRSLKVASMTCGDCASPPLNIYIYISLIILLSLLAFIAMFYFNFGMSPLVDSWLFYCQVGLILPTTYFKDLGTWGTVLTFGLGHLCITPHVNRLQATFLLLTQPATLLVSVMVVRVASSYSCTGSILQRQQKHMRLIRVLWFGLVYSYTMLTFTSLNVLSCTKLDNRLVLAMDGSIECFKGNHIPYAVCAVVIIVLIIIPPPILLILPQAKRKLFFKGFIDQACCMYHDNRRWWASVNLVRRIAVAVILSQFRRMEEKTIFMTIFLIGYLLVHTCWQPLSQTNFLNIDSNAVEKYFLFILLLLSTLSNVAKATPVYLLDGFRVVSYILIYIPTVLLFSTIFFRQCFSEHGGFGRLRHVSLRMWSKRRRGEDVNALATHNLALRNMLSEARDPLIVEEMRNERR